MGRLSAFDRDFRDLHGEDFDGEKTPSGTYRVLPRSLRTFPPLGGFRIMPRRRVDHIGTRLVVGTLGLFFTIVLGVVLAAMLTVAGIAVWAFFATLGQTIPS